jgi:hypothetical protein
VTGTTQAEPPQASITDPTWLIPALLTTLLGSIGRVTSRSSARPGNAVAPVATSIGQGQFKQPGASTVLVGSSRPSVPLSRPCAGSSPTFASAR